MSGLVWSGLSTAPDHTVRNQVAFVLWPLTFDLWPLTFDHQDNLDLSFQLSGPVRQQHLIPLGLGQLT